MTTNDAPRTDVHETDVHETDVHEADVHEADVLVVGAGPTGLMLANELALAGVRCRLLERRGEQPNITRAFAVHARTLELLDARGLADELMPRGVPVYDIQPAPGATVNLKDLPTRYGMILIAPQSGTEKVLESAVRAHGVTIEYGVEVTALHQDAEGVTLTTPTGEYRARYVVGSDGAHSTIRRLAGIGFEGTQYETHIMLADVHLSRPPQEAMFAATTEEGAVIVVPFGDGWYRVIAWDRLREQAPLSEPLSIVEVRDAFHRIAGDDFGMSEPRWSSRFLSERRQAQRYRAGRVFIAGDAAHVHSPLGGQGMNTGIGDAMNLGWKLAAAVKGSAPDWLLDTYQTERHAVGRQVLLMTDGFNRLVLGRSRLIKAVQRRAIRTLLGFRRPRDLIIGRLSGIGIGYGRRSRGDHAWVGRRMPDVAGPTGRLYELMREGGFTLVTRPGVSAGGAVHVVHCEDPALPAAVLVRPDGYVAWAGEATEAAIRTAIAAWCPQPTLHHV